MRAAHAAVATSEERARIEDLGPVALGVHVVLHVVAVVEGPLLPARATRINRAADAPRLPRAHGIRAPREWDRCERGRIGM